MLWSYTNMYLGYYQGQGVDQKRAKDKLMKVYFTRLSSSQKAYLSAKNIAKAMSNYVTFALTWQFWHTQMKNIDIKIRKMFMKCRCHHPRSATERSHLCIEK